MTTHFLLSLCNPVIFTLLSAFAIVPCVYCDSPIVDLGYVLQQGFEQVSLARFALCFEKFIADAPAPRLLSMAYNITISPMCAMPHHLLVKVASKLPLLQL